MKLSTFYMRIKTSSSVNIPLWILSSSELSKKIANEQLVLGLYFGLILIISIYNFFIYLSIRDRSYLYYIFCTLAFGMYQITLNGLSFQYFWPDHIWWANKSLPFFIYFGSVMFLQFGRSFLHTRDNLPILDIIMKTFMVLTSLGTVLSFFLPYEILIRSGTFMSILVTMTLLVAGIVSLAKGNRAARFYVTAWSALLIGIMIYALKTFGIVPVNFFTEWSQQIGSALELSLLSLALADRINIMKRDEKIAKSERVKAQEKFRFLFEGSQDIIFTLDEKWNFLTVNKAVRDHLRFEPDDIERRNFLDIIYTGSDREEITKNLVRKNLEKFSVSREALNFKTQFVISFSHEPRDMQVSMEYISIGGKDEILGKASSIPEDSLIKYFECEKQRFSIGNYLTTAEEISYRITRNLVKFMDGRGINLLRIALREIIINAIEHGNLNISYEEKTEALMDDSYFDFILQRQNNPTYGRRRVEIFYSIDNEKVVFRVTDEGDGFDHEKILSENSAEANEAMLAHGRGISMSKNVFDEIKYNKKGNQVLLVKYFNILQQKDT